MYGGKRQKNSYGTALKYDTFHHQNEEEEFKSRSFRSSRFKRFDFKQQDKKDFQDDEDLVNEMAHLRMVSNFKDLTGDLYLEFKEFEKGSAPPQTIIPSNAGLKKSKKIKIKLNYHYEDELEQESPDLEIKLKTVDSKLKFQKSLPKANTTTITKQQTDPIFKKFVKKVQPSTPQLMDELPKGYVSKFKLSHSSSRPLSRYAATSLLKSRFTSSNESSPPPLPSRTQEPAEKQLRRVEKIEVSDILKKRLGI